MRKLILNSLVFGSLGFFTLGGCAVTAQAPGGGGQMPQQSPQSSPSRQQPGTENPGAVPGNDSAMSSKVDDKKFAKNAALGGMEEVELGKLATQKASSDEVKQFGQRMIDDHTKANDQLKELASKEKIALPDALDSKHQSKIDKLSKLSGPQFDKAYMKDMVKDHQQDVNEFQSEAQGGADPNIKQFAASTLPMLQEHLTLAKNLNKNEKHAAAQPAGPAAQ